MSKTFFYGKQRWWVNYDAMDKKVLAPYAHALGVLEATSPAPEPTYCPGFNSIKFTNVRYNVSHANMLAASNLRRLKNRLHDLDVQEKDPKYAMEELARRYSSISRLRSQVNSIYTSARSDNKTSIQLINDLGKSYRDAGLTIIFGALGAGATGAAAVGVNATKALVDGAVKYYDTGNLGSALITSTGGLVMCGCGALEGLVDKAGKPVIIGFGILIDSAFEAGANMQEGKSGTEVLKAVWLKTILSIPNLRVSKNSAKKYVDVKSGKSYVDVTNNNDFVVRKVIDSHVSKNVHISSALFERGEAQMALVKGLGTKSIEKTAGKLLESPSSRLSNKAGSPSTNMNDAKALTFVKRHVLRPMRS